MSSPLRLGVAFVLCAVAGVLLSGVAGTQPLMPLYDFPEYWAAAKLQATGGNPYSGSQLWQLQRTLDPELPKAIMMWNPPLALTVVAPLGWLDVRTAHAGWLAAQLFALVLAVEWLWQAAGGRAEWWWAAWLAVPLFAPTFLLLLFGQIGGFVLLGLAGFLKYRQLGKPFVAGLFVALTAIKPHMLFVLGILLVIEAIWNRAGRLTLLGGVVAVVVASVIPLAFNPHVYEQYFGAITGRVVDPATPLPQDWYPPIFSYWVRYQFFTGHFWVQFVPMGLTAAGTVVYGLVRRERDWLGELPWVLFLSVVTTAYSGWIFDLVVLLVPVTLAIAKLADRGSRGVVYATAVPYMLANAAGLGRMLIWEYIWFAPAMWLLWIVVDEGCRLRPARPSTS